MNPLLICLTPYAATFDAPSYLVGKCLEAHSSTRPMGVDVLGKTVSFESKSSTTYRLTVDPEIGTKLVIERGPPFEIVAAANTVYEYDRSLNQYTERSTNVAPDASVRSAANNLDPVVAAQLTPASFEAWIKGFQVGPQWSVTAQGGLLVLSAGDSDGLTKLSLDSKTHKLRAAESRSHGYGTVHTLSYRDPSPVTFSPAKGALKVKTLNPDLALPAFASAEAKAACLKVFSFYDHPRALAYSVGSGEESFKVWVFQGRVKQSDSKADWAIAGKEFTLIDKQNKTVMRGTLDMPKAIDTINSTGTRIEPLLKLVLKGVNPYRFYLGQGSIVKVVGRATVNGASCTLLEARSASSTLSLAVRSNDGFVLSLTSTQIQGQASVTRLFAPMPVGIQQTKLDIPQGWQTKPLVTQQGAQP